VSWILLSCISFIIRHVDRYGARAIGAMRPRTRLIIIGILGPSILWLWIKANEPDSEEAAYLKWQAIGATRVIFLDGDLLP